MPSCRSFYIYKHHVCHSALDFTYAVHLRTMCAPGYPLTDIWGGSTHFQRPSVGAIDAPRRALTGSTINKKSAKGFLLPFLGRGSDKQRHMAARSLLGPTTGPLWQKLTCRGGRKKTGLGASVAEFLWLHRAVTYTPSPQPVAGHDVLGASWAGGARQSRRNANIGAPLRHIQFRA